MSDSTKWVLDELARVVPAMTDMDKGRLLGYGACLVSTPDPPGRDAPSVQAQGTPGA